MQSLALNQLDAKDRHRYIEIFVHKTVCVMLARMLKSASEAR